MRYVNNSHIVRDMWDKLEVFFFYLFFIFLSLHLFLSSWVSKRGSEGTGFILLGRHSVVMLALVRCHERGRIIRRSLDVLSHVAFWTGASVVASAKNNIKTEGR